MRLTAAFVATSAPRISDVDSARGVGSVAHFLERRHLEKRTRIMTDHTSRSERAGRPSTSPGRAAAAAPGVTATACRAGLIIVLGLAAGVVVAAGIHAVPDIIGPVFLALVLVITVDPDPGLDDPQGRPALAGHPGAWSSASTPSSSGCSSPAIIGIAQLAALLPQYADQLQEQLTGLKSWLAGMGSHARPTSRTR